MVNNVRRRVDGTRDARNRGVTASSRREKGYSTSKGAPHETQTHDDEVEHLHDIELHPEEREQDVTDLQTPVQTDVVPSPSASTPPL